MKCLLMRLRMIMWRSHCRRTNRYNLPLKMVKLLMRMELQMLWKTRKLKLKHKRVSIWNSSGKCFFYPAGILAKFFA
ncbi:hypothetical protein L6452_19820 [Arctium lappa]|uniref:Uncharacterized protein n=1 Tax=Arctium lappa TaxID=4217 RepID=A0ACB9BAF5_ARCLA|nr:hypothetical protein L6452_19820 [Arctium lappa]